MGIKVSSHWREMTTTYTSEPLTKLQRALTQQQLPADYFSNRSNNEVIRDLPIKAFRELLKTARLTLNDLDELRSSNAEIYHALFSRKQELVNDYKEDALNVFDQPELRMIIASTEDQRKFALTDAAAIALYLQKNINFSGLQANITQEMQQILPSMDDMPEWRSPLHNLVRLQTNITPEIQHISPSMDDDMREYQSTLYGSSRSSLFLPVQGEASASGVDLLDTNERPNPL